MLYAPLTFSICRRGLINDSLYAETFSRSRWSSSSWGPKRIKQVRSPLLLLVFLKCVPWINFYGNTFGRILSCSLFMWWNLTIHASWETLVNKLLLFENTHTHTHTGKEKREWERVMRGAATMKSGLLTSTPKDSFLSFT